MGTQKLFPIGKGKQDDGGNQNGQSAKPNESSRQSWGTSKGRGGASKRARKKHKSHVHGNECTEPPHGKGALKSGIAGQGQLATAPYKQEKCECGPKGRSGEENWCSELISCDGKQRQNQSEQNRSESGKSPRSKDLVR